VWPLQVQKKNYREEKKRATKELLSTITDPSVIVMADWLKVRLALLLVSGLYTTWAMCCNYLNITLYATNYKAIRICYNLLKFLQNFHKCPC
jgi:hypothetical protein